MEVDQQHEMEQLAASIFAEMDDAATDDVDDAGADPAPSPEPDPQPATPAAPAPPAPPEDDEARMNAGEEALYGRLESYGIPAEDLAAIRQNFVPKSSFTRSRQKDRDEVRQVVEQASLRENWYLQQLHNYEQRLQGGNPTPAARQQPDNPVERLIASQNLDEDKPEVAEFIRSLAGAVVETAEAKNAAELEPIRHERAQQQWLQAAATLRDELVSEYGEGVLDVWPELLKATHESGYTLTPKAILLDRHTDKALTLIQAKRNQSKQTQVDRARGSMEGFTQTRRPPSRPAEFRPPSKDADDSPAAIAAGALAYLDSVRRR